MADTPGGSEPADIGTAETTTTLGEDLLPAAEEEAGEERGANSSPGTGEMGKKIFGKAITIGSKKKKINWYSTIGNNKRLEALKHI